MGGGGVGGGGDGGGDGGGCGGGDENENDTDSLHIWVLCICLLSKPMIGFSRRLCQNYGGKITSRKMMRLFLYVLKSR